MTENKLQIIRNVVYGHAVADALGVPVEFRSRQKLRENPVCGMLGYGTYKVPAGTWSDDTTTALAAMDSFAFGVDYDDMMRRFSAWKNEAAYTATDLTFDMGVSTRIAIMNYEAGTPPLKCGGTGENDNGNGSLMRIYPAVLYWYFAEKTKADEPDDFIFDNSALTHGHLRSKLACGLYARVLLHLLSGGKKEQIGAVLLEAKAHYECTPVCKSELRYFHRLFDPRFALISEGDIVSSGYVVSTLEAALWCLMNTDSYADCVLKAVNLGEDTDTVAAVAGSLAGCLYGMEAIPDEWLETLQNKELLEDVCDAFLQSPFVLPQKRQLTDVHGHYVFGVDDGAENMEMAVEMIKSAYEQGVRDVICTAHSWGNYALYLKHFLQLRQQLVTECIPVRLHRGAEIACSERAMDGIIAALKAEKLLPLGRSKYVLLEFDPCVKGGEILRCVQRLREETDFEPVLAHAERCLCVQQEKELVSALVRERVLIQINAYSLEEENRTSVRSTARRLLAEGQVAFVGSDAHRTDHRPPNVQSGVNYIYSNCSREYADQVCFLNARQMLV